MNQYLGISRQIFEKIKILCVLSSIFKAAHASLHFRIKKELIKMELLLCNRTIDVLIFVKNIIQALVLFEGRHLLVNLLLAGIWAGGYTC